MAQGRRSDWFVNEGRRDLAESLRDLAVRREDQRLRAAMETVAETWDKAFALAHAGRRPHGEVGRPRAGAEGEAKSAEAQQRFAKQADIARGGVQQVSAALSRINKLERRTTQR